MDAATLQQAGFSEQEVAGYSKLQSAGFSDSEIADHYSKGAASTPPPASKSSGVVQTVGTGASGFNQGLANILGLPVDAINSALKVLGVSGEKPVGGSDFIKQLLPTPVKPDPNSLVQNIAYAGGEQTAGMLPGIGLAGKAAGYLEQIIPALRTALGAGTGSAIARTQVQNSPLADMIAQILGGGVANPEALPKSLPENTSERLYGSATKLPLSKSWTKVSPASEVSDRTKAIRTGIENKVLPNEAGLQQVTQLEKQVRGIVDGVISNSKYKGNSISNSALNGALDEAYAKAANSSDPEAAKAIIDKLKDGFAKHGNMTVQKAQEVKRQLYKEINWTATDPTGLSGQLNVVGKKDLAHDVMAQLEDLHPELKNLNEKDSALIKLREGLERTVGRYQNTDIVHLGEEVSMTAGAAVKGIAGAGYGYALKKLIDQPGIKARLAFALDKAKKLPVNKAGATGEALIQTGNIARGNMQ